MLHSLFKKNNLIFSQKILIRKSAYSINSEHLDFLPEALAIVEKPTSPAGRWIVWTISLFISLALIWSIYSEIDIVSVARGKLILSGQSKIVQSSVAGIVERIFIENGQHISVGNILIKFNDINVKVELQKNRLSKIDALLNKARAEALLRAGVGNSVPLVMRIDVAFDAQNVSNQRLSDSIFMTQRGRMLSLSSDFKKREQELLGVQQRIEILRQSVTTAQLLAEDYKKLMEKNYVAKHIFLEKDRQRIEQEGELMLQQSNAEGIKSQIQSQKAGLETSVEQFKSEQLSLLNESNRLLEQLAEEEGRINHSLSQLTLVSPVTGTVQQLGIHTLGGSVSAGQQLMIVVPDSAPMELEAQILNQDIGFVREGQLVEIKLDAFPYTQYGVVEGKLKNISKDAIQDERLGAVYNARIQLLTKDFGVRKGKIFIQAGMQATIEIKTEKRHVIDYFLGSLRKIKSEAMKER